MRTDLYYPSAGQGAIHACRWEPEGKPLAVVQIVHGIAEHVERYAEFAAFLNAQGIVVVAEDHMGHGCSVGPEDVKGYFTGGWFKAVQDSYRLLKNTRLEYPDVPYILMGHSMGSFMSRTLIARYPNCGIQGVILSGTGWIHRALVNSATAACTLIGSRYGYDKPHKLLTQLAFGSYNDKIDHKRTDYDWLTRNHHVVDAYMADPMCGFPATAGLLKDMMTGIRYNQEPAHMLRMKKDLPVLFISGAADPVGGYGKGVKQSAQAFVSAGMEDVTVKLYPLCRHELLNEINQDEVYAYLLSWIRRQVI